MYSVLNYGQMITDRVRMEAYEAALRRVVTPDSVVLDIGAGTGIFTLLACQMGARRVFAIEPDSALQVAREVVRANGYADRVTFFQTLSTQVNLPEPADLIVSDLRGVMPLFQHHIPSIADARQRLLRPGGVVIPQRDTMWAAVVSSEKLRHDRVLPWLENAYGFDMRAGYQSVVNTWGKARVEPDCLLCPPQQWAVLDYATITDPDVSGSLTWIAEKPGVGHGLLIWFDAQLIDDVGFSNAPGQPEVIYGTAFFPWQDSVTLSSGDQITVRIEAHLVADDYLWRWNTCISEPGSGDCLKADFHQTTFLSQPLSPQALLKRADHFVPSLNEDGQVDRLILELMGSGLSLGEIATQVAERFASRFESWNAALTRVSDLSEKYSS